MKRAASTVAFTWTWVSSVVACPSVQVVIVLKGTLIPETSRYTEKSVLCGNAANSGIGETHHPHQQAGRLVEVQAQRRLSEDRALHDLDGFVVDGRLADAPLAVERLDACREKQGRLQSGAFQIPSRQRYQRERFVGRRDPARAAVVRSGAVADAHMNDDRPLSGGFGIQIYGNLLTLGVVADVSPLGDHAGDAGHALSAANGPNIFVEDLIDGGPRGIAASGEDDFIGIFDGDAGTASSGSARPWGVDRRDGRSSRSHCVLPGNSPR